LNKILIPSILAVTIIITGIFAFTPIEKASTTHTTTQSTQFNNIKSAFDTNLATNSTATCTSGSFLVYWTFTNDTKGVISDAASFTKLGIDNSTADEIDISVTLVLGNQSSVSGVIGGLAGEVITFSGEEVGTDSGDLIITVHCQSTATATADSE